MTGGIKSDSSVDSDKQDKMFLENFYNDDSKYTNKQREHHGNW